MHLALLVHQVLALGEVTGGELWLMDGFALRNSHHLPIQLQSSVVLGVWRRRNGCDTEGGREGGREGRRKEG